MKINLKKLEIFSLNSSEKKVLSYLLANQSKTQESHISNISNISKSTSLPRTTCVDAIKKLTARGLISQKTNLKEKYYLVSDVDTILSSVKTAFSEDKDSTKKNLKTLDGQITIYSGLDNCHAVWRKIAQLNKGERFIYIQPNQSLAETFKKLGIDCLYPNNDALNDRGIITEGIVNESCFSLINDILSKHKDKSFARDELEKISHRPSDLTLINDSYLNLATELLFMRDVAYLVNWRDQVAIEIQNPTIRDFLKELYMLARGYGKKVNQYQTVQNLLNKLHTV